MEQLRTSDSARRGRVNVQTIRDYERRGLLRKPPRSIAGYRLFSDESVRRLQFIKRAQALGFSLKEIKELLGLRVESRDTCSDIRARAEAKIADIDQKLATLHRMKKALTRLVATCEARGTTTSCPILDSLEAEDC